MNYTVTLPAQSAAGATAVTVVGEFSPEDGNGRGVTRVSLVSPTAVTGAATNNFSVNVRQLRAGSVVATFATFTAGSGSNLAVETPKVLLDCNATPGAGVALNDGDVLDVQLVQNGTGLAVPAGIVVTITIN
ncbi:hypothetical protein [Nocardia jiangxiensis]|uniref:hypothetical protein n=1 Tax=Nocardia jiangxiensis TaxID=282685 RepID=UPI0012F69B53|nr:hypothetical protein [Nocardia jiangxiensis]